MSAEWATAAIAGVGILGTIAIQLIGYGRLLERVDGLSGRVEKVEGKIDKWQEEGIGVNLAKAHSAHRG